MPSCEVVQDVLSRAVGLLLSGWLVEANHLTAPYHAGEKRHCRQRGACRRRAGPNGSPRTTRCLDALRWSPTRCRPIARSGLFCMFIKVSK